MLLVTIVSLTKFIAEMVKPFNDSFEKYWTWCFLYESLFVVVVFWNGTHAIPLQRDIVFTECGSINRQSPIFSLVTKNTF